MRNSYQLVADEPMDRLDYSMIPTPGCDRAPPGTQVGQKWGKAREMKHLLLSELLAAKWGKWGKAGQPHFSRPNCLHANDLRKWGSLRAGKGGENGHRAPLPRPRREAACRALSLARQVRAAHEEPWILRALDPKLPAQRPPVRRLPGGPGDHQPGRGRPEDPCRVPAAGLPVAAPGQAAGPRDAAQSNRVPEELLPLPGQQRCTHQRPDRGAGVAAGAGPASAQRADQARGGAASGATRCRHRRGDPRSGHPRASLLHGDPRERARFART